MNKYTFYGSGIFCNRRYTIEAPTKKDAIEKAKKEFHGNVTVRTFKRVK